MDNFKAVLREMLDKWGSSVVVRSETKRFSGGLLSGKTLANLDSQGVGPRGAFKVGTKTCYPAESLVEFLEARARPMRDGRPSPRDREREARTLEERSGR